MLFKKTILVVAAHPDDEILGCGGTINKLSIDNTIHILILGEGITSREEKPKRVEVQTEIENLHNCAIKVSKIIGAESIRILSFPDNRFDSVCLLDVIKSIENAKKQLKPDVIFTHHPEDLNIDHRITFKAVLTACRPSLIETVKEIYSFEVPSSTEWQYQTSNNTFKPNLFITLDEMHINAKIESMETYISERRNYPHPRSPEAIRVLAKYRGINVSTEFAESFEIIRKII